MSAEVVFRPGGQRAAVRPGTSLLDAARKAKVPIRVRCDGKAACLMCKVQVKDQAALAPAGPNEARKLGSALDKGTRLACQARISDSGHIEVELPEDPLKAAIRAQLARQQEEDW